MASLVLATGLALSTGVAQAADGALQRFLDGLHSLRTGFIQQVHDASGKLVESGSGTLLLSRPGRFRWEYRADGAGRDAGQLLLADGRNLWFLDRELDQATVRPQAEALGATPMLLLTGNVSDWQDAFSIADLPRHAGLEWQVVAPRAASADFTRAELGFRGQQLVEMQVYNQLGQQVTLRFSNARRNALLPDDAFRFTPGPDVDVVGQPLP